MTPADPTRDLLAAIRDALDLPLPDLTEAAEQAHAQLLSARASRVRIAVESALDGTDTACTTAWLRDATTETPARYAPWTPRVEDGGQQ